MKEVEVKLIGLDEQELIDKIIKKGGVYESCEDQINIRINSTSHPIPDPSYLRLRQIKVEGKETVNEFTFKTRVESDQARVNREYTCIVNDPGELLKILSLMGYDRQEKGRKIRKRYLYKGFRIEFDHWDKDSFPFPYIEVEGESPQALTEFLEEFSIPQEAVSTKSIAELKNEYCKYARD